MNRCLFVAAPLAELCHCEERSDEVGVKHRGLLRQTLGPLLRGNVVLPFRGSNCPEGPRRGFPGGISPRRRHHHCRSTVSPSPRRGTAERASRDAHFASSRALFSPLALPFTSRSLPAGPCHCRSVEDPRNEVEGAVETPLPRGNLILSHVRLPHAVSTCRGVFEPHSNQSLDQTGFLLAQALRWSRRPRRRVKLPRMGHRGGVSILRSALLAASCSLICRL